MATKIEIAAKIQANILDKTTEDQITPSGVAEILTDLLELLPDNFSTISGNTITTADGQTITIEPDTKATINSGVITFADGQTLDLETIDTDTFATISNGIITDTNGVEHSFVDVDTFAIFDGNTTITFEDGQVLDLSTMTVNENNVELVNQYSNIKKITSIQTLEGNVNVDYQNGYFYAENYNGDLDPNSELFNLEVGDTVYLQGLNGEIGSIVIDDYVYADSSFLEFEFGAQTPALILDNNGDPILESDPNWSDSNYVNTFNLYAITKSETVPLTVADALSFVEEKLVPYTASEGLSVDNNNFTLGGTITTDIETYLVSNSNDSFPTVEFYGLAETGEQLYFHRLRHTGDSYKQLNSLDGVNYANFRTNVNQKQDILGDNITNNSFELIYNKDEYRENFKLDNRDSYVRSVSNSGLSSLEQHTYYDANGVEEGKVQIFKFNGSINRNVTTSNGSSNFDQEVNQLLYSDNNGAGNTSKLKINAIDNDISRSSGANYNKFYQQDNVTEILTGVDTQFNTLKITSTDVILGTELSNITDPKSATTKEYVDNSVNIDFQDVLNNSETGALSNSYGNLINIHNGTSEDDYDRQISINPFAGGINILENNGDNVSLTTFGGLSVNDVTSSQSAVVKNGSLLLTDNGVNGGLTPFVLSLKPVDLTSFTPSSGNISIDSLDNVLKKYNGTEWISLEDIATITTTDFTLLNNWENFSTVTPAKYFKSNGIVRFENRIKNGDVAANIFTLPAGFRPEYQISYPVLTSTGEMGILNIFPTGSVTMSSVNFSNTWVSLSSVSFRAHQ